MAANTTATSGSVAGGNGNGTQQKGVEERLRILLSLLESSKEDAKNGREDTLQYLSQLESVARRLKDQLLNDNVSNDSKVREFKFPAFTFKSFSEALILASTNMAVDCSLIFQFSKWKLQAQNMLCA